MKRVPAFVRQLQGYGLSTHEGERHGVAEISASGWAKLNDDQARALCEALGRYPFSVWIHDSDTGERIVAGRRYATSSLSQWINRRREVDTP